MPIVAGISLRTAGKVYFFDPGDKQYYSGERVLVETARGVELGTVRQQPHEVPAASLVAPLKPVIRRANAADLARESLTRDREAHALEACRRLIEKLALPMRLIDAQYTFDGSHLLIHFLADNRVDFRELVREWARDLRTRIELRQVGVRDEAKLVGGYGVCGRPFCCSTFLNDFSPVAISMAKEQGLALNPQKISGMCGRLMCCLAFEHAHYKSSRADLPRMNARVETPQGAGKVTKVNVMTRQVEVMIPDAPVPIWFAVDDVQPATAPTAGGCCGRQQTTACGGCGTAEHAIAPAGTEEPVSRKRRPPHHLAQGETIEPRQAQPGSAGRPPQPEQREPDTAPARITTTAPAGDAAPPPPSGRYRPRRRKPRRDGGTGQ